MYLPIMVTQLIFPADCHGQKVLDIGTGTGMWRSAIPCEDVQERILG